MRVLILILILSQTSRAPFLQGGINFSTFTSGLLDSSSNLKILQNDSKEFLKANQKFLQPESQTSSKIILEFVKPNLKIHKTESKNSSNQIKKLFIFLFQFSELREDVSSNIPTGILVRPSHNRHKHRVCVDARDHRTGYSRRNRSED